MVILVKLGDIHKKRDGINIVKEQLIKEILEHEEWLRNRHKEEKKKIKIPLDRNKIGLTQKERNKLKK